MTHRQVASAFRRKIAVALAVALILPAEAGSHLAMQANPQAPFSSMRRHATGLKFTHVTGESGQYYMAEQMGAGVALFDYDGDDDLDVFFVQGGPAFVEARRASRRGPRRSRTRQPAVPQRSEGGGRRQADAALHRRDGGGRCRLPRLRNGRRGRRLRQRRASGSLRHRLPDGGAVSQQRQRHVCRRHRTVRDPRNPVEHQRSVPRLRPGRPARPLRGAVSRLHARVQQDLPRRRRRARLLQPALVQARSRRALPQRRQRKVHQRQRHGGHQQGIRRRARRLDRRLQRRRLARPLRRQRRHAEPVVDQHRQGHVPRRRACCPDPR